MGRTSTGPLDPHPRLAAFLKGPACFPQDAAWAALGIAEAELQILSEAEELSGLIHQRLIESGGGDDWPLPLREAISQQARAAAAAGLLRAEEIREALDALGAAGIGPILIKGTALAYGWYDSPAARPRADTDLLIPADRVGAARRTLDGLGYAPTVHCSDLFSQFEAQKTDCWSVTHAFDVHWKISTQPVFADLLTYEELAPRTVSLPRLGPFALAPRAVDALLLACVHPVMHHRNVERVLWIYDIHLIATSLGRAGFEEFADLARQKRVAAICAHGLRLAQTVFGTAVPAGVLDRLGRPRTAEPSAAYLASQRRWHHELVSSLRGLPSIGARARMLRDVLFPSPHYMLAAYGLQGRAVGPWLLPALYVDRNLRGLWKILSGKK